MRAQNLVTAGCLYIHQGYIFQRPPELDSPHMLAECIVSHNVVMGCVTGVPEALLGCNSKRDRT